MKQSDAGPPNRELYSLPHLSPDANDEEIRRAFRQWAQVYHPDNYQSPQMKEVATQNFQRICKAYEILSDEHKRQIYDIYGMEGLTSGLELGPKLSKADEIKEEIERLLRRKKDEKVAAHVRPSGTVVANLSLSEFLEGESIVKGMGMSSELQSQLSKRNVLAIQINMAVNRNVGGGGTTLILKHQLSSFSSIEFIGAVGLQALLEVRSSRQLSAHSTATMGLAVSLRDGSINLSNARTRQLSETSNGNVLLSLTYSTIRCRTINICGLAEKYAKLSAAGDVKVAVLSAHLANTLDAFDSSRIGRVAGKVGSHALDIEIGGGRKISEFSTVRLLYSVGIQDIFWKFELHHHGQKLIVPNFVAKPYYLKREQREAQEKLERTAAQVKEVRAAADRAQRLLENVANRKRNKQSETDGLVITKSLYGNSKFVKRDGMREANNDAASQVLDITLPLNFLVCDSGELKHHEGVKKSGIMRFCDPCPGEPKLLHVECTYGGNSYEVDVDDYEALRLPNDDHRK